MAPSEDIAPRLWDRVRFFLGLKKFDLVLELGHCLFHLLQEQFGFGRGASRGIHQRDALLLLLQNVPAALKAVARGFHLARMHAA